MENKMISVQFSLKNGETDLGQSIALVGNHPLLGNWNPLSAIIMHTSAEAYPVWKS